MSQQKIDINQISSASAIANQAIVYTGSGIAWANVAGDSSAVFLHANSAYDKANSANVLAYNTGIGANAYAATVGTAGNNYSISVGAASNTYANTLGAASRDYANTTANSANAYAIAIGSAGNSYTNSVGTAGNAFTISVGTAGNNYSISVGAASNTYSDTLSVTDRAIANAAANSANAYTITVGAASNTWANGVGTAGNSYTNAVGTAGNNYSITVGAAANTYTNTVTSPISNTAVAAFLHANNAYNTANNALPKAGGTITGDLVVQGNATFSGLTTYANTQTLLIGDNILTLNADIPGAVAPSENAGIEVARGSSANVSVIWNEGTDKWTFTDDGTVYRNIASNTDVESVATGANSYAAAVGTSANAYAVTVGTAGNSYTNAVGTAGNNYTNAVGTAGNTYSNAVGAASNNYSNATFATISYATAAYNTANAAYDKANTGGGVGFSTVNANGTLIVSDTSGNVLTLIAGSGIAIAGNSINDTITISANVSSVQGNASSQSFVANGVQTIFNLSNSIPNQNNAIVTLDGLVQVPQSHYSISGGTLTFVDPPFANSIVEVRNVASTSGPKGIQWKGSYSSNTAYTADDVVQYGYSTYICIANTSGNIPTSNTYWNLFVDGALTASVINTTDTFSGTGAQTAFTLSVSPAATDSVTVFIDGVYQQSSKYTISGSTLTFGTAPPTGTDNIQVRTTSVTGVMNGISNNSVDTSALINAAVTEAKIANGAVTSAKIADGTIVGADIANTTIGVEKINATGTLSNTTYLRGDSTWATVSSPVIDTQTFNASGTWTKPAGYSASSRVLIQAWGAGGSGSRFSNAGSGGGGGSFVERWLLLSDMGSTETVTIGAGGTSVNTTTTNGNAGGDTTVGSLLTAYGGRGGGSSLGGGGGGQFGVGSGATPGAPLIGTEVDATYTLYLGSGAPAAARNGIAGVNHGGGGGSTTGVGGKSFYGGGGGGGGSTAAGGTSVMGGNGGAGGGTATAGSQPGGGGGGTNTGTSGKGGDGRVIITVFPA